METKEIKIQVPEGYEVDKEKSSFERIVFKKKKVINCWKDLENVHWSGLTAIAENKNVFLNEKYTKSALALAQISQLLPYYDSNVDWKNDKFKYCIDKKHNKIVIKQWIGTYHVLAFNSEEEVERFLKHNEQLVKDYFML